MVLPPIYIFLHKSFTCDQLYIINHTSIFLCLILLFVRVILLIADSFIYCGHFMLFQALAAQDSASSDKTCQW
jgi:hypothetical protein